MKIAVVGGGGVGGFVAAKLAQVAQVDLISGSLKKLCLEERGKISCYDVPIYPKPPQGKIYDLVIFAVKSYVLDEAIAKMRSNIGPHTLVLPLLNGIEPYEKLKKIFPNTLKGAIYIISHKKDDTIEVKGKGAMIVMENNEELQKLFEKAGIKVKMPQDIDRAIWQKYLFIAASAALTTLYDATFGEIAREHLDEFRELLEEIVTVANAKGVDLNAEDVQRAIEILQKSPAEAKTSMQLDFEKGSQTELDNIVGYLAKESPKFAQIYKKLRERSASV